MLLNVYESQPVCLVSGVAEGGPGQACMAKLCYWGESVELMTIYSSLVGGELSQGVLVAQGFAYGVHCYPCSLAIEQG